MNKTIRSALLCCFGVGCLAFRATGGPAVFQIGVADGDYHEFAIAGDWAAYPKQFPHDTDFVVGRSDPARDWPYVLPGPADAWAGNKPHTFTIHFRIPQPAPGYYQLALDFVSTHPAAPPRLAIAINGEKIERQLPRGSTDDALTHPKVGKHCSLRQIIPSALLRAGDNTIALSDNNGSWALFDDVRLESGVPPPSETLSVKAGPLPFFKRTPEGLRRAVRVSIDNLEAGAAPAVLVWKAGALSGSQKFDLRFGENSFLITVPDMHRVELTLRAARREVHQPLLLPPAKKWRVYIVPTVHTDIGYTDFQQRVRVRHANNGLRALKLLDAGPFFKWYSETFWQLDALLQLHPEVTDDVFSLLRRNRWGLSGDYANMLTGLCSSEALNRLELDSRDLANRGGFKLDSVILDDVPSAVGSLPMVLANSGVKYFIEGANNDRAPYAGEVPNPFYWEGADGSRVLADITTQPGYAAAGDLLPSVERAMEQLPPFLARFETADYPYDAVLVNGAFVDNRPVESWLPKVVREWNAEWAYPKLIFAQPDDFFGYIEKNFSNNIPVLKTDFGDWWADGAGSTARATALSRRAEERAVSAEMLHSLAGILAGAAYPKTNFDQLWHNILLYNEHTWGAWESTSHPDSEQTVKQWAVKRGYALDADAESHALQASAMAELATMAPAADWVVFNPLAWSRNAAVQIPETIAAVEDLKTKRIVPCQPLPGGGSCFVADDLPSIGYRCYRVATTSQAPAEAVRISGDQIENEFYRVTLDPKTGGIQSIYDKQLGRELVDTNGEFDLGELIYVTGGEGTYAVHSDLNNLPPPKFEYHRQTCTGIKAVNGPVFGELVSLSTNVNFPAITLRVRLYRGLKQLDLIFGLDKTETLNKEAVYLAFPFAFDARKGGLWLQYPDEITNPLRDQHASACRDWYAVQQWLAVSDGADTVELSALDTPLFTLGGMTASTWPREMALKRGHVFAYVMNNYWHTNYKAEQGGRFLFRYSITSRAGAFSKPQAVEDGWGLFCPPVAQHGESQHTPVFSSAAGSLVGIQPVGLPLTAIKEAEAGDGFVFRCCDFSGAGGMATLTFPAPAREVSQCNLVETDAHPLKGDGRTVTVPLKPFAPLTLKARFAP
ncbi:MAG: hypothetical protein KGJ60_01550 [Verrucomicrobiota bacterium]|nr:hypothetical protein [Verrucomicrobiota bacterium]